MRLGRIVLAAALLAAAAPVAAQQPAQPLPADVERFQSFLSNDATYKELLQQLALMSDAQGAPDCKERKAVGRTLLVVAPPTFPEGAPYPSSGLWQERVVVERCGGKSQQNILIQARPDGPPRAMPLMPGTTGAPAPMQSAILKDVVEQLASGKAKCSDLTKIQPLDSGMDKNSKLPKPGEKGSWREVWNFRACGKKVDVPVEYTADGKGGLTHKVLAK
ncbi:MAG: hypothetical protein ACM33T_00965 [Solirubrobacterales bacterium]